MFPKVEKISPKVSLIAFGFIMEPTSKFLITTLLNNLDCENVGLIFVFLYYLKQWCAYACVRVCVSTCDMRVFVHCIAWLKCLNNFLFSINLLLLFCVTRNHHMMIN